MLKYVVISTEMGWIAVISSENGLVATTLPQRSAQHALMALGQDIGDAAEDPGSLKDITVRLQAYFQGEFIEFNDKIDPQGTPFQKQVWAVTRRIPYGQTQSYLWVAKEIKRPSSARAVGQALGANPLPIIVPCHRVLTSSGELGGFGGGVDMKHKLLQLENWKSPVVKI